MLQPQHHDQIAIRAKSRSELYEATRNLNPRVRVVIPFPGNGASVKGKNWYKRIEGNPIFLLRLSLATVFLWFGLLKLANASPVDALLRSSFSILANPPYVELLGLAEIVIAIGLILNRFARQTVFLMILHLLGTLSVAALAPQLVFAPRFPLLTMEGEFLVKNLVLIAAGIVIMFPVSNRSPLKAWQ